MKQHTSSRELSLYLEHARHLAHSVTLDDRVLSHLWQVSWREEWPLLRDYLRASVPKEALQRVKQWALNMVLVTQAQQEHEAWQHAWPGEEDRSLGEIRFRSGAVDLRYASLEGANLGMAQLEGVDLRGANLESTNLEGADLRFANLEGANLKRAYLKQASLFKVCLKGANLEGACLSFATMRQANCQNACFVDVNLSEVWHSGSDFKGARFRKL